MSLNFASDNTGPMAPEILAAITAANGESAMPYGNDRWTRDAQNAVRVLFEMPKAEVLFVSVGTAANALALSGLCAPFQTVICHRIAHIEEDECGAPEFYTGGAKLTLVDGADGKMTPDGLRAALATLGAKGVHGVQKGVLSLTNVTEAGTLYTLAELAELVAIARDAGLATHLDGARFANACAALGCSAAELATGFDMISFGGTKNGCMGVEAVVIRDAALGWEMELRRKRAGHLWSKGRFLGAQMSAYVADDLWLDLAGRANAAAARLAEGVATLPGATLEFPPQANILFARIPRAMHARAMAAGAEYYLMEGDLEGPSDEALLCRMVCDWSKDDATVDQLLALLRG